MMNIKFSAKSIASFLPLSRIKLLEEVINDRQHGAIWRVWLAAGHLFIATDEGRQLFTFDTKPADYIQETEQEGYLDMSSDIPVLEVLTGIPNTVYTVQRNGHVQQWRFRTDYTWTLQNEFDVCNVASAEVTDICLNVSHNALYWCEKRISSATETATYCICKRQLKEDNSNPSLLELGSVVALVHNCPSSKVYPMAHGILMVTECQRPGVSVSLTLCTLTGNIEVIVGSTRALVKDCNTHNAIDFRYLLMKSLHHLHKASTQGSVCGSTFVSSSQSLVSVGQTGQLTVIYPATENKSQAENVFLEDFVAEGILNICSVQKFVGVVYSSEIRLYSMQSGRRVGSVSCPEGETIRGPCRSLLGAMQSAFYTDTDMFIIQRTSKGVSSSDARLIESSKFQTDAIRLAFLNQLKCEKKSQQQDQLRQAWSEVMGRPPNTKLVSIVDPYLKEYWKLEHLLQDGLKAKENIAKLKGSTVDEELDHLLDTKSSITRTARQAQLQLLSQTHPQQVLNHLLSSLDLGTDELSTSQLQLWRCVLTQENCEVSGSCDLAIPLFEHVCHLLFKQRPDQLMNFLRRGQQVCDQLVGVSAFIRKRQTLQVYQRALRCIPDPVVSLDQLTAVSVTVQLLLKSEVEGSVLKAARVLVKNCDWPGAVDLLTTYADSSTQHVLIFQIILTALKQHNVLHKFSKAVFELMPSFQSVEDSGQWSPGKETDVAQPVFCEADDTISMESVRPDLLRCIADDTPEIDQG